MTDPVTPDIGAENITVAMFRAQLDSEFRIAWGEGEVPLRLIEITDPVIAGTFEQFSLIFHGPSNALLPDGLHTFHHQTLGWFAIFIVPLLGSNAERIVYQASFNRPAQR